MKKLEHSWLVFPVKKRAYKRQINLSIFLFLLFYLLISTVPLRVTSSTAAAAPTFSSGPEVIDLTQGSTQPEVIDLTGPEEVIDLTGPGTSVQGSQGVGDGGLGPVLIHNLADLVEQWEISGLDPSLNWDDALFL